MANPQRVVPDMFRFTPSSDIPGSHELTEVEHLMVKISKSFSDLLKLSPCLRDQNLATIAQQPDLDPAMRTALRRPRTNVAQAIVDNYLAARMPLITDILYTKYPSAFISLVPSLRSFQINSESRSMLDKVWDNSRLTISTLLGVKRSTLVEEKEKEDIDPSHWPPPLPRIRDPALLRQVFCHRSANTANISAAERSTLNNERLEFKGDTVLGGVIVDLIYHKFPSYSEGDLTKLKSRLVSNKLLQEFSLSYDLPERLDSSAEVRNLVEQAKNTGTECKFIADLFEAYIGGVEVDQGFEVCRDWLHKVYAPFIQEEISHNNKPEVDKTAKVELHRVIGADIHRIQYDTIQLSNGQFETTCTVDDEEIGRGLGVNKRESSSKAAMDAISKKDLIRRFSEARIAAKAKRQKERDIRAKKKHAAALALAKVAEETEQQALQVPLPDSSPSSPGSPGSPVTPGESAHDPTHNSEPSRANTPMSSV